ncbi:MAG: HIT domain-containing protein [Candidatus Dependentiae bacterium]|nr:HIT domain-containing protein [Candidatus Dependentiae bacterium]
MAKSIFSKIIDHEIPADIIAENEDVIVIRDIAPKAPIHLLIIPKLEVRDIQSLTPEQLPIMDKLFAMAQQLSRAVPGAEDFRIVINSGERAGQRVFHLHLHFLAGERMFD